jgi:hypothetical protein
LLRIYFLGHLEGRWLTQNRSHYLDYLDLRSDGRIVLYKRADHQNPKWTVRLKIPRSKGFVVKSAKTADDFEANVSLRTSTINWKAEPDGASR